MEIAALRKSAELRVREPERGRGRFHLNGSLPREPRPLLARVLNKLGMGEGAGATATFHRRFPDCGQSGRSGGCTHLNNAQNPNWGPTSRQITHTGG